MDEMITLLGCGITADGDTAYVKFETREINTACSEDIEHLSSLLRSEFARRFPFAVMDPEIKVITS